MTIPSDDKAAVEVSSPACSMHEADDAYMGYAGEDVDCPSSGFLRQRAG